MLRINTNSSKLLNFFNFFLGTLKFSESAIRIVKKYFPQEDSIVGDVFNLFTRTLKYREDIKAWHVLCMFLQRRLPLPRGCATDKVSHLASAQGKRNIAVHDKSDPTLGRRATTHEFTILAYTCSKLTSSNVFTTTLRNPLLGGCASMHVRHFLRPASELHEIVVGWPSSSIPLYITTVEEGILRLFPRRRDHICAQKEGQPMSPAICRSAMWLLKVQRKWYLHLKMRQYGFWESKRPSMSTAACSAV